MVKEAFMLFETVTYKSDVNWCWKRQQSDVNETGLNGNSGYSFPVWIARTKAAFCVWGRLSDIWC